MVKQQITEAEKAATGYTDELLDYPSLVNKIHELVLDIERTLSTPNRNACIALRDYSQLLVAQHMDAALKETKRRIKELEAKLEAK